MSRDPIGVRGGRNLFAFVLNNPVSYADMDGRRAVGGAMKCILKRVCGKLVKICAPSPFTDPIDPPVCNPQNWVKVGVIKHTLLCSLSSGGALPMASGGWLLMCQYRPCRETIEHVPGPPVGPIVHPKTEVRDAEQVNTTERVNQCPEPKCPSEYKKKWQHDWFEDFS